jgi:hypothetical protein
MNHLLAIGFTAVASILRVPCLGDDAGPKEFHPSPDPANRGGWVLNEVTSLRVGNWTKLTNSLHG